MKRPRRNRSLIIALYTNAALLLAILLSLMSRDGAGSLLPRALGAPLSPQPIAGNGSLYLMPAQLLSNVWGCYVLDIDNQILCTYSYNGNQLRLVASRSIRADHQLAHFNTSPDPDEIQRLVEIEKTRVRGLQPALSPSTQESPRLDK